MKTGGFAHSLRQVSAASPMFPGLKTEKAEQAAVNRTRFGRSKAERHANQAEAERESVQLDQKRLTGPKPDPAPRSPEDDGRRS